MKCGRGPDNEEMTVPNINVLKNFVRLIPLASTALSGEWPLAWRRVLGFGISAPVNLMQQVSVQSKEVKGVVEQLGAIIALVATPAAARSALAFGLESIKDQGIDFEHAVPVVMPVIHVAFGGCNAFENDAPVTSDFLALLRVLRFIGLSCAAGLSDPAVTEAKHFLRLALECHMDVSSLSKVDELDKLRLNIGGLRAQVLKKKLKSAEPNKRREAVVDVLMEGLAIATSDILPTDLIKLAKRAQLPSSADDDDLDAKMVQARASGALFFEDVDGVDVGLDDEDIAATIGKNVVEPITNIEQLQRPKRKAFKISKMAKPKKGAGQEEDGQDKKSPMQPKRRKVRR